jgi:predicted ArsR family transcriptional regulator
MLKGEPPQPVSVLSHALDITPMAVRQHLLVLERDGLVQRSSRRRPVGRPESIYALTAAARSHYPDHHDSLACELLESVRDRLGAAGLDGMLSDLLQRRLERGRERVQGKTPAARLAQLTALQDEAGFMATCDPVRGEIVQRHCTVCSAAEEFPALCALEQRLFEGLLGAPVERVEHVLQGGAGLPLSARDRPAGGGAGRRPGARDGEVAPRCQRPGSECGGRREGRAGGWTTQRIDRDAQGGFAVSMLVQCGRCGQSYARIFLERDATCRCGESLDLRGAGPRFVDREALVKEENRLAELARGAERVSFLIVATDCPRIDVDIERAALRRRCKVLFPDKVELFDLIYESRFRRLWEQFRA